jgi:hypothetical protein
MAEVTLYKPDATVRYPNATEVTLKDGVLFFAVQKDAIHPFAQTIRTNVPFVVMEEVGG